MAATRHVLYYSQFSQYCNEVLTTLTKRGLKPEFVMVCVDQSRGQIPHFVTAVPTILTTDRRIMTDEWVMEYVEEMALARQQATDPAAAECSVGGSCFSFVEGGQQLTDGFMSVDGDFDRIYTPQDGESATPSGREPKSSSMDSLMETRARELQTVWNQQPRT